MASSKVEALEAEGSKLRKNLIIMTDEGNVTKEKVKDLAEELKTEKLLMVQKDEQLQSANQKIKTVAANAIQAFQLTEECNIVLFNWYYKGFELLKRYLVKHGSRDDLENLDFESIDKEMEANEAAQAAATNDGNPANPKREALRPDGDDVPTA